MQETTETPTLPAAWPDHYLRGVILVMLAGCFWSLGGILVRSIEAASAWQILWLRSLTAALMLFAVLLLRYRWQVFEPFRRAGLSSLAGALCLAVGFSGFIFALTSTTVANAVFILSAAPFPTALLAWLILGERVRRAMWFAMLAAVTGVAVMVADGVRSGMLSGNLMALLSTLGFAGFAVALRCGRHTDMLPAVCLAGVLAAAVAASMSESLVVTPRDLALCVTMGVVQLGFGMLFFTLGARHVPAAELTLLSLTEVILGPLWVWLGVGETPSLLTLLGGVIVLGAIVGLALSGVHGRAIYTTVRTDHSSGKKHSSSALTK